MIDCPEFIIALLSYIDYRLDTYNWNKDQEEFDSPFENTGGYFKNDTFEVKAYNWEDEEDGFFKYKDIKISWYKYLGRGTTINKEISFEQAKEMFDTCLRSLEDGE